MKAEKTSRATSIRRLLADGKTPLQIAATLGCLPAAVHSVIFYDRKKAEKLKAKAAPKRGPGRPKAVENKTTNANNALLRDNLQLVNDKHALLKLLDETRSQHRHAEATLHAEIAALKEAVMGYRGMGFIERLGFLFRGA